MVANPEATFGSPKQDRLSEDTSVEPTEDLRVTIGVGTSQCAKQLNFAVIRE